MMEPEFLLICCLLSLSSADVRDAISGVGVKVDYGGLHPPLSHAGGLEVHGTVSGIGTLDHSSGVSSEGVAHGSQQFSGERGGANNVFFHAKIGGSSHNGGGAISTHDVSSLSGQGRETGTFGSSLHQTGSVTQSNNGGTHSCCGENKNAAPQPVGFVGAQEQSSPVNTGGHSSEYANLIGNLGTSSTGGNSGGQASGGSHSTESGRSGGFQNLIGTLDHSNTGSNTGGHSSGFANLIGTVTPSNTGSNTGGHFAGFGNLIGTLTPSNVGVSHRYSSELSGFHTVQTTGNDGATTTGQSAGFGNLIGTLNPTQTGSNTGGQSPGFGNLIGTLTPTNTGSVSHRYSSEQSGFQNVGNAGGMTTGHPVGFANLIGTIKPGEISTNYGPSVEFGHSPSNAGATGSVTGSRGFSGMQTPMTLIQAGNFAGSKPETQPALSHVPAHTGNHAGFSTLEYKVPETPRFSTLEYKVPETPRFSTLEYKVPEKAGVSTLEHKVPEKAGFSTLEYKVPETPSFSTLEYKVPESAQRQAYEHHVGVPAISTFSANNGASVSSHGQIGTFPAITMVDVIKSVEIPHVQIPQAFGISASHQNIPSAGRAHFHSLDVMPVRYNTPSFQINYQRPSVLPAHVHSNFNAYQQAAVPSGGAGSYTGPVAGQHRSYQAPTSFGYTGGYHNVHHTHSSSHANSHAGHEHEEFEGY